MWPAGFPPLAVCSALELLHQEQLGSGGQEGSREAAEPRGCVVGFCERQVGWVWHLSFLD